MQRSDNAISFPPGVEAMSVEQRRVAVAALEAFTAVAGGRVSADDRAMALGGAQAR